MFFLLFLGVVMYANEVETKKNERLPEIKKLTSTYMYTDLYVNMPTRPIVFSYKGLSCFCGCKSNVYIQM